jgi:dynein light intermediate chain
MMVPPNDSLVKYDNPVLVSTSKKSAKSGDKKAQLPPVSTGSSQAAADILAAILPPREWTADGALWVQNVSSTPATRLDVITLQEQLDQKLQQRQARETGICPVREELYAQCFDELIRQVTINCGERGILLLRVRDEIRMTISAYQTLYESSIAFGMRKALMAEQKRAEMEAKIKRLAASCTDLERQSEQLRGRIAETESAAAERRAGEEEKHRAEVSKLQTVNDHLREKLEALLAAPKKQ